MKKIIILTATVLIASTSYSQNERAVVFSGTGLSYTTAYEINTPAQLARLAELVNRGEIIVGTFFKLTADIDLSAYGSRFNNGKGWIPIGNFTNQFSGHFNGNNHTVIGL